MSTDSNTGTPKVLIANRGAIATRLIRTFDRLGIDSVAVYAESDRESLHVQQASEAHSLGAGNAASTYLDIDRILGIARETGCSAIHPGYGFLSENAGFVQRCDEASIAFIGPTAEQIRQFGQKHIARELATAAGVPLPPGTGLLNTIEDALTAASEIGYPIMLKSTAGGGGIGMQLCDGPDALSLGFASVKRLGGSHFANDGVFLEKAIVRARHIEVQIFGDGQGQALAIGERDCSAQRRNQKVIEECPAPRLSDEQRHALHRTAERLMASVNYRNAGTVEFILDDDSGEFYFLEVNTRLQVEHGVTELVYGLDLVEWMLKLSQGRLDPLSSLRDALNPSGHAIQVRVYAEDPYRHFQPCPGLLTRVSFPQADDIRVDHWIEAGITVPTDFDPMLAKVLVAADTRTQALMRLREAITDVDIYGCVTNVDYLSHLLEDAQVEQGQITTRYLDHYRYQPRRMDVLRGGTLTTVQDLPGRSGYWSVGIPPSGPFDALSFELGNRLLGNEPNCAGLEITLSGPELQFSMSARVVVTGAEAPVAIDGDAVAQWTVIQVTEGQRLSIGKLGEAGARAYLCIEGGIDCPEYLGSRSTFTLGEFGGHNGAQLKTGDVLPLGVPPAPPQRPTSDAGTSLPPQQRPDISNHWNVRVMYGPHGSPEYFTPDDIAAVFSTEWEVHYNSSRTGVRLIGPVPQWARKDGGEAGLHPSNIHDNAYAFGTLDFTGDMPVILGPDGPSLGGFVCPATVISADLWKLGQLRAGDTVHFVNTDIDKARSVAEEQRTQLASLAVAIDQSAKASTRVWTATAATAGSNSAPGRDTSAIVDRHTGKQQEVIYRIAGDQFLLIEYGDQVLDLALRFRAHAVMNWLQSNMLPGIRELTPGIRSLQVHYDSTRLKLDELLTHLHAAEEALDQTDDILAVPSRIVHLPLSWNDEACQLAIEKYDQVVRKDAPWYPSNLEFIRRINGLDSIDAVKNILFEASYLVMGLGDVYLGAPVATPVNPAHRLVTTKYNPARTWTAENSVGIGGSYLCVYGMEGPGGYQFVGRTLQMWNRYRSTEEFTQPWLLRFFDQIRFYEVSHDELMDIRQDFPLGRYPLRIEDATFSMADYQSLLADRAPEIDGFRSMRQAAFQQELDNWRATGQFNPTIIEPEATTVTEDWPEDCAVIESPVTGSLWKCLVAEDDEVKEGQAVVILESMKMEIQLNAPVTGRVRRIVLEAGQQVTAGQVVLVLDAD